MQTVEYNLGVYIDHYVMVDFSTVINGINQLGGIDVYVPYNINDPTFPDMDYGFDPLFIAAGQQHFDGLTALKYARTRHQDNDFYRARRQQQVALAVRDKALALGLPTLIVRAPSLYSQFEQGIRTDLSLQEIIQLAQVIEGIPDENIQNEVLDQNYVSNYLTENGAQVLIPINEAIEPLIRQMFYNN
jgi:anionic cell wall polymer biosynthesis LytR-Cps2A-Psr (LCP) family protein